MYLKAKKYKPRKEKIFRTISTLLVTMLLCAALTVVVSATNVSVSYNGNNDISMSSILHSDVVKTIKSIVITLVNPIASVSLGATLIGLMFSSSPKQAENLIKGIKGIVWAFALINSLGLIFTAIGHIVGSNVYTF